jgi:hypothetical protein
LIQQHLATLLGFKDNVLPNPAEEESCMELDEDPDADVDPSYPYPGGPGHPFTTEQTLAIMRQMMDDAGIKLFRPDFNQPCNSPDNQYLFDLAVNTFIELVKCNEYSGIDLEVTSEDQIQSSLYIHFTQRLQRQ